MDNFCRKGLGEFQLSRFFFFLMGGVILFQALVMFGVWGSAHLPLWTGTEIRLATRPVDPRSLFRGNYARLGYDISRIPAADVRALFPHPRPHERLYVRLAAGADGLYQYQGISKKRPDSGLFIRGRLDATRLIRNGAYPVTYGIEAFFAPPERALALEKQLAETGVARIWVAPNGRAVLGNVEARGETNEK
ncbi:MAG: GDYXXLXY domain-containing protein [Desulfobacterales bacterium]|nr:GDYXXLXY domain-containing protein [Desulfobacterales bacterium]